MEAADSHLFSPQSEELHWEEAEVGSTTTLENDLEQESDTDSVFV